MLEPSALYSSVADAIEHDWLSTARPNQLPPDGEWSIWLMLAGRGFGKTRAAAEWVRSQVESGSAKNVAIVGATAADVRDVCVEGPSGILAISPNWNRPIYEPSKRRISWPNGAQATLFSSEEPDRLRGPNHDCAWCDELGSWSNQIDTWNMLQLTLRLGRLPRVCVSTTPKPGKLLKDLISRDGKDVVITRGSTFENAANLAPAFLDSITRKYQGTRLGRQELSAELLEDIEGALWTPDMIEAARCSPVVPVMKRIVVALDPAVSVGEDSDETGIVVAGLGDSDLGYVLQDASGKYAPVEWAKKAVDLYRKWHADQIVSEINQGGDLVQTTIRTVDPNIPFRGLHAKRGKIVRAEPISALYEQQRVRHAGIFPELEDQMCTYAGGGDSPDRLDAAVYALSDLMLGFQAQEIPIVAPFVVSSPRYDRFGSFGPNSFLDRDAVADQARCYADKRSEGFTIKRF
jgi:phage terminase large subunit-like protein